MRALRSMLVAAIAGLVLPIAIAGPAAAHESREVGPYEVVVGWWTEPAFANQPNGPEITVRDRATGEPVAEGVELEVEIIFGEETTTLETEPAFGDPGNYNADIFPTRSGTYTFHFTGTIEGEDFDEEFTSGPDTFNDINDPAEMAFPAADPSNAELAERLEQESARVQELAAAASDDASAANTLALIALIVGGVALVAGVSSWVLGRRRART